MKKIISLLVCISLLFSLLPMNIYAADKKTVQYIDFPESGEVYFEAEDYANIVMNYEFGNDDAAYKGFEGSGYIYIPRTVGANLNPTGKETPGLEYYCNVKKEQMYFIWIYLYTRGTGSRTLYSKFDNNQYGTLEAEYEPEGWRWQLLNMEYLREGKHVLGFTHRHMLIPIDRFIVSTNPDFIPEGTPLSKPEFLPEYKESRNVLHNLPAITPPNNVHPRLLVNASMLPYIRENLHHPQNENTYQALLKSANIETDGRLPIIDPTAPDNISIQLSDCAQSNALMWLITGEEKYAEKAVNVAKNQLLTVQGKRVTVDSFSRHVGDFLFKMSCVYDWCYDYMTDEDRQLFLKYIFLFLPMTEVRYPNLKPGSITGHNTEGEIWKDFLAVSVAIYDEDPKVYNLIAGRIFEELIPVKNFVYQSDCFTEGVGYGAFRFFYEMFCAYVFKAMGYDVFSKDQQFALYGQLYRRRPDGKFWQTGDYADEELYGFANGFNNCFFLAGNYYKDPILKREYYRTTRTGDSTTSDVGAVNAAFHLIVNDVSVPGNDDSHRNLPLTDYSQGPPGGYMNARTSWDEGTAANTLMVQMNVREYYFNSHQHADAGHFDIYYKGCLAVDAGLYESDPYFDGDGKLVSSNLGYGSPIRWGYTIRSAAHNTMLVNSHLNIDKSQYQTITIDDSGQIATIPEKVANGAYEDLEDYHVADVLAYDYGPDMYEPAFSYLKGDLTKAYPQNAVKYFARSFVFMNFFDEKYPGALIVFDDISSQDKSFEKTWQLHTQEKPEIDGSRAVVRRTEFGMNGRLINDCLLPAQSKTTLIGGPGYEFVTNGLQLYGGVKTPNQEAGKWTIYISPEKESVRDHFLNVMQMSDNNDEIEPLKAELIEDGDNYVGVRIKDRVVYLKKDSNNIYKDVVIDNSDADGDYKYFINNLNQGKWTIFNSEGVQVSEAYSYDEHNTVIFEAPAGKYTLKWSYVEKMPEKSYKRTDYIRKDHGSKYDIMVNNRYESYKNEPYDINGNLYLDAYKTLELLEFKNLKEENGKLSGEFENDLIELTEGSATAYINGNPVEMEGAPVRKNGVLYFTPGKLMSEIKFVYRYYQKSNIAMLTSSVTTADKMKLVNSDEPNRIRVKSAWVSKASSSTAYDTVDNNLATYWAGEGDGEWIKYEFEEPSEIKHVDIKWHVGDQRAEFFEMLVSNDDENWTKIFDGQSCGTEPLFERFNVSVEGKYKYLKIIGHMNSVNNWNSMSEIQFYKE